MKHLHRFAAAAASAALLLGTAAPLFARDDDPTASPTGKISQPGEAKDFLDENDKIISDQDTPVKAGETANFQLESNLPSDILSKGVTLIEIGDDDPREQRMEGRYEITFHDVMDAEFTPNLDALKVFVGDKEIPQEGTVDGKTVPFYTVSAVENIAEGKSFTVTLNIVNLFNAHEIDMTDFGAAKEDGTKSVTKLFVRYSAKLEEELTHGRYINSVWATDTADKEKPEEPPFVDTEFSRLEITKKSTPTEGEDGNPVDGAKLDGAIFQLYKAIDNKDGTFTQGEAYGDPVTTGDLENTAEDETGMAIFNNVPVGHYYIVETKAPDGFIILKEPVLVDLRADKNGSYVIESEILNTNIPETGGAGTFMYTMAGAALVGSAVVIMALRRRSKNDADEEAAS